jgi:hypothetical protein
MMAPVMIFTHWPGATAPCQALPGQRGADHLELQRGAGGQLRAVEGEAVHGGVVVRRHADRRDQVARQHAAERVEHGDVLGLAHRVHQPFEEGVDRSALSACGS